LELLQPAFNVSGRVVNRPVNDVGVSCPLVSVLVSVAFN
jgi:hypothetical protein